jgi:hypothetical protein
LQTTAFSNMPLAEQHELVEALELMDGANSREGIQVERCPINGWGRSQGRNSPLETRSNLMEGPALGPNLGTFVEAHRDRRSPRR